MKRFIAIFLFLASAASAQVQQFGIFSPVLGMREDVPAITLQQAFTADNENIILRHGEIHRVKLRSGQLIHSGAKAAAPDGFAVLKYHYYQKADGTNFLFTFTKQHAYQWDTATTAWLLKFTSASANATAWSVVTFNNVMYATNNVDKIQCWSGTGDFAPLGSSNGVDVAGGVYLTKAKFLAAFETYLMAGNVVVANVHYPLRMYWSDTNDASVWNAGNADYWNFPGPDPLTGTGKIDDFLLVFSGRSIDQMWSVDSSMVFNSRRLRTQLGCYSPDSVVNGVNGELYFMDGQKNLRMLPSAASEFQVVSDGVDKTLKLIPDGRISLTQGVYISEYEQKWWAVPYGQDAESNTRVLCLDKYGAWTRLNIPVAAWGEWEEKTPQYTWNNISLMFSNWNEAGWIWDTVEARQNARLDICGDYSGYTYNAHNAEEDNGSPYAGYAVIATDFSTSKGSPALDVYKRLTGMTVYFRNEGSGTADLSVKRDLESAWQAAGSVNLAGSGEILWQQINCDFRARHYMLKISGANPFRFIGVIFYYVPQGLR